MSPRLAIFDRPPAVVTDSVEVAQDVYRSASAPIAITRRRDAAPFMWRAHLASVGRVDVSGHQYGGELTAQGDAAADAYSYSIPLAHARSGAVVGGTTIALVPGSRGSFVSPGQAASVTFGEGHRSLQVKLPRADVDAGFASLTGRTKPRRIVFASEIDLQRGAGASLHGLSLYLADEAGREGGALASPVIAARFADTLLFTLLLGLAHDGRPWIDAGSRPAEPEHVRKVAEYLDAHAARPVRMIELTAITGMTLRAIQAAFRRHRGCSPSEFLHERRLLAARAAILAVPQQTISQVAVDHGFPHLGRFSVSYRARFGETPSETRARTR